MSMIHSSAIVSSKAELGSNITIGPFTIVHENVRIGDGSQIGSHCEIGYPTPRADGTQLIIGTNSLIRSHSVLYEGSSLGEGLVTGHRVSIREGTKAGKHLQVGTSGEIQGTCCIGDYVRLHSNVHIGQYSTVGNFVWIFPSVVLNNDPHPPSEVMQGVTLEDYAVIATMSVILPGITIGQGALVAAHSSVNRDVDADTVVAGNPARSICKTNKIVLQDGSRTSAYPWRRHFHRGYPQDVVEEWLREFPTNMNSKSR